jgi:hypothetical protein
MSIIRDVERTIIVKDDMRYCDECGKLVAIGQRDVLPHSHCGECERTFCNTCYGDIHTQIKDVYMIPCKHCRAAIERHPEYIDRMVEIKKLEDNLRREYWEIQKKIGKSSRTIFKSVKPVQTE